MYGTRLRALAPFTGYHSTGYSTTYSARVCPFLIQYGYDIIVSSYRTVVQIVFHLIETAVSPATTAAPFEYLLGAVSSKSVPSVRPSMWAEGVMLSLGSALQGLTHPAGVSRLPDSRKALTAKPTADGVPQSGLAASVALLHPPDL